MIPTLIFLIVVVWLLLPETPPEVPDPYHSKKYDEEKLAVIERLLTPEEKLQ